jgi:hypothetical protein
MKQEIAETAAIRALGWLVAREDLVEVFLGSTGAGAEDLRARAAEPEFLASVLDFILMDDAWIMDVRDRDRHGARATGPIAPGAARCGLPNWT